MESTSSLVDQLQQRQQRVVIPSTEPASPRHLNTSESAHLSPTSPWLASSFAGHFPDSTAAVAAAAVREPLDFVEMIPASRRHNDAAAASSSTVPPTAARIATVAKGKMPAWATPAAGPVPLPSNETIRITPAATTAAFRIAASASLQPRMLTAPATPPLPTHAPSSPPTGPRWAEGNQMPCLPPHMPARILARDDGGPGAGGGYVTAPIAQSTVPTTPTISRLAAAAAAAAAASTSSSSAAATSSTSSAPPVVFDSVMLTTSVKISFSEKKEKVGLPSIRPVVPLRSSSILTRTAAAARKENNSTAGSSGVGGSGRDAVGNSFRTPVVPSSSSLPAPLLPPRDVMINSTSSFLPSSPTISRGQRPHMPMSPTTPSPPPSDTSIITPASPPSPSPLPPSITSVTPLLASFLSRKDASKKDPHTTDSSCPWTSTEPLLIAELGAIILPLEPSALRAGAPAVTPAWTRALWSVEPLPRTIGPTGIFYGSAVSPGWGGGGGTSPTTTSRASSLLLATSTAASAVQAPSFATLELAVTAGLRLTPAELAAWAQVIGIGTEAVSADLAVVTAAMLAASTEAAEETAPRDDGELNGIASWGADAEEGRSALGLTGGTHGGLGLGGRLSDAQLAALAAAAGAARDDAAVNGAELVATAATIRARSARMYAIDAALRARMRAEEVRLRRELADTSLCAAALERARERYSVIVSELRIALSALPLDRTSGAWVVGAKLDVTSQAVAHEEAILHEAEEDITSGRAAAAVAVAIEKITGEERASSSALGETTINDLRADCEAQISAARAFGEVRLLGCAVEAERAQAVDFERDAASARFRAAAADTAIAELRLRVSAADKELEALRSLRRLQAGVRRLLATAPLESLARALQVEGAPPPAEVIAAATRKACPLKALGLVGSFGSGSTASAKKVSRLALAGPITVAQDLFATAVAAPHVQAAPTDVTALDAFAKLALGPTLSKMAMREEAQALALVARNAALAALSSTTITTTAATTGPIPRSDEAIDATDTENASNLAKMAAVHRFREAARATERVRQNVAAARARLAARVHDAMAAFFKDALLRSPYTHDYAIALAVAHRVGARHMADFLSQGIQVPQGLALGAVLARLASLGAARRMAGPPPPPPSRPHPLLESPAWLAYLSTTDRTRQVIDASNMLASLNAGAGGGAARSVDEKNGVFAHLASRVVRDEEAALVSSADKGGVNVPLSARVAATESVRLLSGALVEASQDSSARAWARHVAAAAECALDVMPATKSIQDVLYEQPQLVFEE
jgi:hypothetical protein